MAKFAKDAKKAFKLKLSTMVVVVLCGLLIVPMQQAAAQDVVGDLLGRINSLRASLGLHAYSLNGALSAAALSHAVWMAETGQVSHTQPNGSTPTTRAAAAGYPGSWVSENIYAGTNATTDHAWGFWINSPIHYRGLTNGSYDEIGIGYATTSWGSAFVLVFGASGSVRASNNSGGGNQGGGNAAAAPPSFVVGVDSFGNIMHEVQDGHTVGDIALIYGYTWDDIPEMLELNHLTEADFRVLQVGSIFLVPPLAGTYTPTPGGPPATPGLDPSILTAVANVTALPTDAAMVAGAADAAGAVQDMGILPTPETPLPIPSTEPNDPMQPTQPTAEDYGSAANGVVSPRIATAASVPDVFNATAELITPAVDAPTSTPAPASPPSDVTQVAMLPTLAGGPALAEVVIVRDTTPPWLIGALILQSVIIGFAAFEFVRRRGKK